MAMMCGHKIHKNQMEFGLSGVPFCCQVRRKMINMNNLNFSLCFTQSQNMTLEDLENRAQVI